jgi:hypothetical protein
LDELDPPNCDEPEDEVSHEDKVLMLSLPFDEVIQAFDAPVQKK